VSFVGLVAVCAALGYGAWMLLTRPTAREGQTATRRMAPANDSMGFLSVAGEGVELEVLAPDGRRTLTSEAPSSPTRIARSETQVDCPGVSGPGRREPDCTASINLGVPLPGDYTIIARATSARAAVLTVGWATASQVTRGGFNVTVQVARNGATAFSVIVTRDNVSRRTEPRPYTP
jgi:hypothetical protein